jgi:hypothetical protein
MPFRLELSILRAAPRIGGRAPDEKGRAIGWGRAATAHQAAQPRPAFTTATNLQMKASNKQRKQEYKQAIRPMGVFQIRNLSNGKLFLVAGIDLAGAINRHRFQLAARGHPNQKLQRDWNDLGADSFAFEILDQMSPADDARSSRKDLESLEDMWLDKLRPYDERGYNEPKISRDERLRRIAAHRKDEDQG